MTDGIKYPFAPVDLQIITGRQTAPAEPLSRSLQNAYNATRYQGRTIAQYFPPLPVLQNTQCQGSWENFDELVDNAFFVFGGHGFGPTFESTYARKLRGEVYYDYAGTARGHSLKHTMTVSLSDGTVDDPQEYESEDANIKDVPYGWADTEPLIATFEFDHVVDWSGELLTVQVSAELVGSGTAETFYRPVGFRLWKDLNNG